MSRRSLAFLVSTGLALAAGAAAPGEDLVWVWFSKCDEPRSLVFELESDGRVIHTSRFSVCLTGRGENVGKQIAFPLTSKSSHFGEPPGSSVDVNVWEAGGERTGMILGVSFMSANRVWLNTLHFAEVDRQSTSTLAPGIVVKTYPVTNAKAS